MIIQMLEKMNLKTLSIVVCMLLCLPSAHAQRRCASVDVRQMGRQQSRLFETEENFEKFISLRKILRNGRVDQSLSYTVPVVVHVIHKGQPVGVSSNISDEQILSQIDVLNKDFQRANADSSKTPSEFLSAAGGINLKFVMALQDPNGKSTTGIVRVKGAKTQWSIDDESTLKRTSYWPAEDYLNIWVTDLSSDLLGYAQFPVSSSLNGLEDAEDNRLTDGVVIDYSVFGTADAGSFNLEDNYDKGRTATHEVGHFFGLRHIWGDDNGSCSGNGDYVSDTPNQGDYTSGCPTHPQVSCSVNSMFQNYMDYTSDACMNLFTNGQVDRMVTVLQNSPRRNSMLTSHALNMPAPVTPTPVKPLENDLSIISIQSPGNSSCPGDVTPIVQVVNKGNNAVATAVFNLSLNGIVSPASLTFNEPLQAGDTMLMSLNDVTLTSGNNALEFDITQVNGVADTKTEGNTFSISTYTSFQATLPMKEVFTALPDSWHLRESSPKINVINAVKETTDNSAIQFAFYNTVSDQTHILYSPIINVTDSENPFLIFDVAYAQSKPSDDDALEILIVPDCAENLDQAPTVYLQSGLKLSNTTLVPSAFVPSSDRDWRHEVIDLKSFKQLGSFRLAFSGINKGGNNIYIDDVIIVDNVTEDVALEELISPAPVLCSNVTDVVVRVKNNSAGRLESLRVAYSVDDDGVNSKTFRDLGVTADSFVDLTLSGLELPTQSSRINISLKEPNGLFDIDTTDNTASRSVIVNLDTDILPLRQNFSEGFGSWIVTNASGNRSWSPIIRNFDRSILFEGIDSDTTNEAWLVSPLLDFSTVQKASMFFDLRKVSRGSVSTERNQGDVLKVVVATNCGSFSETVFEDAVEENSAHLNTVAESWSRKYVDLTRFAGNENIRVAFAFRSRAIEDLYLDNIEFFLSDNETPLKTNAPYTLYGTDPSGADHFYITFNLDTRQEINYTLIDLQGRTVLGNRLDNVLNQTYTIVPGANAGIYLLKVQVAGKVYTDRLYIGN